jgi:hypothetical protein
MSSISSIHTLIPNASIPLGYFDEDNIRFIQKKITQVLKRIFTQDILIDRGSIIRLMERAITDRIEVIVKMNQRVIMMASNEFIIHQMNVEKHLNWEQHYVLSQSLYDPSVESVKYDSQNTKLPNRLGLPKVGGTSRFYFT